ncbi:class I adenylate-forming enzyme family protein [Thermodesulfobacteriota bacterium]
MKANTQILIHHFLETSAKVYPDKTALIHENIRATYSEINSMANQLAHWLIEQGITKGDRIVLILENSLEYVVTYYGILKSGAVAVPLSTDLKPNGLNPLIAELEPEVIITNHRFERLLKASDQSLIQNLKLIIKNPKLTWRDNIIDINEIIKNETLNNPNINILEEDLSSIIYTSGSTGKPKGVMLSHRNIVSNTHSICQYLNLSENDIQMVVLPFFYVMGKSLLNTHFSVGGTVVINNKFAYPAAIINQMIDEKVSGFAGVPSTYAYLLHRSPLGKYRDKLDSLRYCSQAGGHMSRQIKEELRSVLPDHTQIYIMYGATEASARLTYMEPERFYDKIESIGKPIPGVFLKVLDPEGKEVPIDQKGELVGSGPNIMQGYWKDKKSTDGVLNQDGYHTGDMGYKDKEGYFYVTGRKDNLLKVGGHRVNTQEIEDTLMATRLLMEAVVLGIPDKLLGNRLVTMAVSKNENCSERLILSSCAEKLPKYKLPNKIKFVRSLPKHLSGKVDRTKCLELVS